MNPWNTRGLCETIVAALTMSEEEKKARHQLNLEYVTRNTAAFWGSTFVGELASLELFSQIPPLNFDETIDNYKKAKKRYQKNVPAKRTVLSSLFNLFSLFLLDYDGTLTPIVNNPMDAIPSRRMINILQSLSLDHRNYIYIVSGRDRPFLNSLFGGLPVGTGILWH